MTKSLIVGSVDGGASTTVDTVAAGTDKILYDNSTGKTPIRIDKCMLQWSGYLNGATIPHNVFLMIHMTDKSGNSLTSSISNNVTTTADFLTLLSKWKDNLFMTDFQMLGTGMDETNIFVSNMEANTRRIIEPGQKLIFSVVTWSRFTEGVTPKGLCDAIVWSSPASQ